MKFGGRVLINRLFQVYGQGLSEMKNIDIDFEVSGLEDSSGNALKHYEIKFSEPVNATWLQNTIKNAIKNLTECPDCGQIYDGRVWHPCPNQH